MAGGLGTWNEVREMSIAQIRCCLAACDRRDATLSIMQIDAIHAAMAPLLVGENGQPFHQRIIARLRGYLRPFGAPKVGKTAEEKKHSWFGVLKSNATKTPLTPQETSFAAHARARLLAQKP